mmetsp:Transcript_19277/g.40450  ORF Transcript_19277/g.40450 Transcript_19277/m.40450 type:complete len:143 (-) Transcript_19277:39-467(-)
MAYGSPFFVASPFVKYERRVLGVVRAMMLLFLERPRIRCRGNGDKDANGSSPCNESDDDNIENDVDVDVDEIDLPFLFFGNLLPILWKPKHTSPGWKRLQIQCDNDPDIVVQVKCAGAIKPVEGRLNFQLLLLVFRGVMIIC